MDYIFSKVTWDFYNSNSIPTHYHVWAPHLRNIKDKYDWRTTDAITHISLHAIEVAINPKGNKPLEC